ncbi:Sensor histidine kinase WalK [Sulfitobacter indolifex]|uniref:histidine kinase n=1 Tax=Sulfitobacter indolifex HEL-45 TaxID=391624 RepID=A0ABP2DBK4_9RHOB|nr:ATP-binding protein [Sulfitobacter indolifex]EDQ05608.1 Signal transduction histidine kinase [Sulfitobacter indolifex HEL-45]UOA19782.1 Sensor histidine kinase WalK [Sulfitobacter indolifex]
MVSTVPTSKGAAETPSRAQALFRGLITAVVLTYFAGLALLTWADYNRATTRAEIELEHFAELYERAVDATLSVANVRMRGLIDELATALLDNPDRFEAQYGDVMAAAVNSIEQVDSLGLIGADGVVLWATAKPLMGRYLGDRAYFQAAIGLGVDEYTVGVPIKSRATGRRFTPIAWPLIGIDGRVRGVLASSLGEDYYAQLLAADGLEPDMHVEVVTAKGERAFVAGQASRDPDTPVFRARKAIPALDLYVDVTRSKAAVMRSYWQRTLVFGGLATILFLTVINAAIRARRQSTQLAQALRNSERDRERIRAAQSGFDAIFENVGDGIIVYNGNNTLYRSNRRARALMGVSSDIEAVDQLRKLVPPFAEMDEDAAVHRIHIRNAAHENMAVQCRVMKMHLQGDCISYNVLQDISAEERLAAARTAFVMSVNHELSTPLRSLAGSLEILHERFGDTIPKSAGELLTMATRNAERLLVLVNDIQTLQAIDQQQLSIQFERVAVSDLLSEAIATNSGYGANRDVRLKMRTAPDAPQDAYIRVDPVRMQQILSNLISNAIKYTPRGGTVKIGADVDQEKVTFYVCDAGPGIPRSAHDRMFKRFADPVHSRDTQAYGTGLGLAITEELVTRQGGDISFETQSVEDGSENPGTTFFVRFARDDTGPLQKASG